MRWHHLYSLAWVAIVLLALPTSSGGQGLRQRQATTGTVFPTLTSDNGSSQTTDATPSSSSNTHNSSASPSTSPSPTPTPSTLESSLPPNIGTSQNATTATRKPTKASITNQVTATTRVANSTSTAVPKKDEQLPIKPRITPALSIGGVVLILTGVVYALVGVKNIWIHTFLSTAYLTSLSIAVLIGYVMSPPISNAIQGAYFVAIFMTGLIFGAGSLIFKEVTEGLGCLLGGFCLSMWFLTLKKGGLIVNATGKGIFIGVFCVVVWSLSFSHYTRAYGLIGCTALSGATFFVLGIDCFSRAGLKEFWFYIWGLNTDLFPLGTTTYPITRGIRVETIVVVLGTIVGVMSQVKLWKIVRDKQRRREEAKKDNDRRKEVVEEALGRHIERHNDRDRAIWERQYGDRLQAKRSTILWSEAHPDEAYTHIAAKELTKPSRSSSSESLEMATVGSKRALSSYSSRNKRVTMIAVDSIPEEQEDQQIRTSMERQKALNALENEQSSESLLSVNEPRAPNAGPEVVPLPFKIPTADIVSSRTSNDPKLLQEPKRMSKRRSLQSLLSLSPRPSGEMASESQEALVLSDAQHSRPSSVAATLDEDNDRAALYSLSKIPSNEPQTPTIVVFPADFREDLKKGAGQSKKDVLEVPPSPPALTINFDFDDPEELARPANASKGDTLDAPANENRSNKETKASRDSEGTAKRSSESYARSNMSTGQTSCAEGLTKGALDQVPSQVSNVVLSYRTNEWAKHIATAEEPVFDEPESIEGPDAEPATRLAPASPPVSASGTDSFADSSMTLAAASKPPVPHIISSNPEGNVTASVQPPKRSASDSQIAQEAKAVVSRSPAQLPQINSVSDQDPPLAPAGSMSAQSSRKITSKAGRASLNTTMKPSLATTPIHENEPAVFGSATTLTRRSSVGKSNRVTSTSSLAGMNVVGMKRASTWAETAPDAIPRSNSYNSMTELQRVSRSSSVMSHGPAMRSDSSIEPVCIPSATSNLPGMRSESRLEPVRSKSAMGNMPAMRSETRLDSYNSRQPQRRDISGDADRRQNLLAEWRMSQQQGATNNYIPKHQIDTRRAQMLLDKEHKKVMEEQQKATQLQKQYAIDQVMRSPDMQDLHREAMRKMQGSAKKGA